MLWILLGFFLLVAGLFGLRGLLSADPPRIGKWLRYIGAGLLSGLAAMFAWTGRLALAAPLAGWALLLLRKKPPGGFPGAGPAPAASGGPVSEAEALEILGLQPEATGDEVRAAHRRLMQACHPDRGGSTYLAARLNAARDKLISG